MAGANEFTRRAGDPFDDMRVERFAVSRAHGKSIKVSAEAAGVGMAKATTWEQAPEVRARIREMAQGQQVAITASPAWVVELLKQNAIKAQEEGKYKDSTDAAIALYKIIKTDSEIIGGVGTPLAQLPKPTRDELRKALSAAVGTTTLDAIAAEGVEVPA